MPQNIGDNRISDDGISRITQQDAERLSRYRLQPGDIVYSRRGDVEKRALVRDREDGWLCGTGCLRVRLGSSGVNSEYAAFYLGHPAVRGWIVRHAHGATMPNLNTSILSDCPFVVAPRLVQRSIASILGALDDKIELNRRTNETLEALARAIFKDWFVDFGPTRAKAEHRAPYLAPELWDPFPDRLDAEGKPEGWRSVAWGELSTLEYGKRLTGYKESQGPYKVFGTNGEIGRHDKALCESPSVIVGRKGAYRGIHFSDEPFFVIDTAFYLRVVDGISIRWCYYSLKQLDINSMDSGSAIPSTSRESFYRIPAVLPPDVLHSSFDEAIAPLRKRQHAAEAESQTLAQARDLLLPKLLSGEIRLKDAEKTAEAVT